MTNLSSLKAIYLVTKFGEIINILRPSLIKNLKLNFLFFFRYYMEYKNKTIYFN